MTIKRTERLQCLSKVQDAYDDLYERDYLEDRREYDLEDWVKAYPDWTEEQCSYMMELVSTEFDTVGPPISDEEIGSMLGEAEHEGYSGWSPGEAVIIKLFVADIKRAVRLSRDEPDDFKGQTRY